MFCFSVLHIAPVPVLHGADSAHHPDADGERARVDRGVARRGLPAVPAPQVDHKPCYNNSYCTRAKKSKQL